MVAEHTAARRARTRRTTVRVAVAAILVLGVLFGVSQLIGNDDDPDTATSDETDTQTSDTAPEDPDITRTPEEFSNPELAAEVQARGPGAPAPPPADTAPDALETTTLTEGEGDGAEAGQILTVHYIGYLPDGSSFDQSWERGQPFTFQLGSGNVIPGWDNGLEGAKIGERRHLVIGADNAYGATGSPPAIPPSTPLSFDVDIVEIQPAPDGG
jgi:peptidylprolyl isomerase